MSQETASADETEESGTSLLELWRTWYDMVGLAFVMVFMLWVRLQSRDNFIQGEEVLFSGNDAFYHFRQVSYVVNNWPLTMPYDPWTGYPYGTSVGQFGTLFDQLIATAALIVGLGDPSSRQVALVVLVAPAVFGALVALPVYYIVRRFHGRGTGLFAAVLLAVMPGVFFRRSTVGFADHHVAEVLFMGIGVLGTMVALGVAERELPVYEQVLDQDWAGLRTTVVYSALAGVAVFLYLWVWPPGAVLVGILGVFYTVALVADFLRGRSPEHVAFVGVVSMSVVFLLSLLRIAEFGFSVSNPSLLQPLLALAVAVWTALLAGAARIWESESLDEIGYPVAVFGSIVVGVLFVRLLLPDLYSLLAGNVLRGFGFGGGVGTLTIAEAQPSPGIEGGLEVGRLNTFLYAQYGLAYVVGVIGLAWIAFRTIYSEYRAESLLLVVWSVFLWLMALTQVRFHYYLVLSIVVLTAWVFGQVVEAVELEALTGRIGDIKPYQVITVVAAFMLLFAPLLPPLAATGGGQAQSGQPAFVVDAGSQVGPGGSQAWSGPANWVEDNTPEVGNYGGADNADEFPYYGTFGRTDDYDYPEGAYGIMSWWDYGHWITVLGERPPHANPFQENARSASSFLQASSEERANAILAALPAIDNAGEIDEMSTEELQSIASEEDGEGVRYVMIDDQTAARKFSAVTQWSVPPDNREEIRRLGNTVSPQNNTAVYYQRQNFQIRGQNATLPTTTDRYRDTMLSKLYFDDADQLSNYRLVHESSTYSIVAGQVRGGRPVSFGPVSQPAFSGWTSQARNLSRALENRRGTGTAVEVGGGTVLYDGGVESRVKVYERVPGATITGTVEDPANLSVLVSVRLETSSGRQFTYDQWTTVDDDGSFAVTVPYATNNVVGPEMGGTNTSVTAVTDYQVRAVNSQLRGGFPLRFIRQVEPGAVTAVPETAVYGGETISVGTVTAPDPAEGDGNGNESGSVAPALSSSASSPSSSPVGAAGTAPAVDDDTPLAPAEARTVGTVTSTP